MFYLTLVLLLCIFSVSSSFRTPCTSIVNQYNVKAFSGRSIARKQPATTISMNIVSDAFRFFSNMNKEASAKHILMSGPNANDKLSLLKGELDAAEDLSNAFSELAAKVYIFIRFLLYRFALIIY